MPASPKQTLIRAMQNIGFRLSRFILSLKVTDYIFLRRALQHWAAFYGLLSIFSGFRDLEEFLFMEDVHIITGLRSDMKKSILTQ